METLREAGKDPAQYSAVSAALPSHSQSYRRVYSEVSPTADQGAYSQVGQHCSLKAQSKGCLLRSKPRHRPGSLLSGKSALQPNPRGVYSEVSPTVHHDAYFQVGQDCCLAAQSKVYLLRSKPHSRPEILLLGK